MRLFIFISTISNFFGLIFFLLPPIAHATTLDLATPSSTINLDQEFTLDYVLYCDNCKDSFLRGVFSKGDTTNYFGYTKNDRGEFINQTSDKTLFYHLTSESFVSGSCSGKLVVKVDPESHYYQGGGDYQIKIGRYTSANSSALWSNSYPVQIQAPLLTPSSTPSPTLTSTLTPSKTPTPITSITPSPTPTISLTKFPTSIPTDTITTTPSSPTTIPTLVSSSASVLGDQDESEKPKPSNPLPAVVALTSSVSFLIRRQYHHFHH